MGTPLIIDTGSAVASTGAAVTTSVGDLVASTGAAVTTSVGGLVASIGDTVGVPIGTVVASGTGATVGDAVIGTVEARGTSVRDCAKGASLQTSLPPITFTGAISEHCCAF